MSALGASLRRRLEDDPRLARIVHGGSSGLMARCIALLVSAISLPLTVRYLGRLEYGLWITISSTVVMLNVLDLGIANTLTNLISEAHAEDDRSKARTFYATAFWLTGAVTVVLALLCGIVWRAVDWGSLLHIADPQLVVRARAAVGISMLFFLISMPLGLANRVLGGYQQVHLGNYFSMVNSVLGLVAILITVALRGNLVVLMMSYCSAILTGSIALNVWLSVWHKPWIRPDPRVLNRAVARTLFRQGSLFFVVQLCSLIVFNSDNLVITHFLGASEVTPYSIAWRLTSYASLLQGLLIPSAWPAFTEAYRKGEMHWLRKTFRSINHKTLIAVSCAALAIGLFGQPVIRLWAGAGVAPPLPLLWTMAFWAVLLSFTTNQALLLTAAGRLRILAIVAALAAVVNFALSLVLVRHLGAEGVILATIVSFAVVMLVPQQMELRRTLRGDFRESQRGIPTDEALNITEQTAGINP